MSGRFERILIIADIEGSSGCWNRRASSFMTREWSRACVEMTRDVNAVVQAKDETKPVSVHDSWFQGDFQGKLSRGGRVQKLSGVKGRPAVNTAALSESGSSQPR